MAGKINTPLGRGRIVYKLPDGTYVVELDHGSGHIFHPEELFPSLRGQTNKPVRVTTSEAPRSCGHSRPVLG